MDDQIACPTFACDVAEGTSQIVKFSVENPNPEKLGTFHLCGQGETSWYRFALLILEEIKRFRASTPLKIKPISTADFCAKNPHVAARPLYSSLNCQKIEKTWGITQKPWKVQIPALIKALENKRT